MSKIFKVCVDVGHDSKHNQSPVNPKYIEGVQMWKLWEYLRDELAQYGIEAYNTRSHIDEVLVEQERGKKANGADMFISLHSNAASSPDVTGTEIIVTNSSLREFVDFTYKLKAKISEVMGDPDNRSIITRDYYTWQFEPWDEVQNTDYYGVLRGAQMVDCFNAMLIEHGFHTNADDVDFLMGDYSLRRLATEEAALIAEFLGAELIPKPNPPTGGVKYAYRIQLGYFENKTYADAYLEDVQKGYPNAFIKTEEIKED